MFKKWQWYLGYSFGSLSQSAHWLVSLARALIPLNAALLVTKRPVHTVLDPALNIESAKFYDNFFFALQTLAMTSRVNEVLISRDTPFCAIGFSCAIQNLLRDFLKNMKTKNLL